MGPEIFSYSHVFGGYNLNNGQETLGSFSISSVDVKYNVKFYGARAQGV